MTDWAHHRFTANDLLLDRQLVDSRGMMAGRIDDLELSDPEPDPAGGGSAARAPVLTALLCGPIAYGPRLGGRLGTWWAATGRRLRGDGDGYPCRIPLSLVARVDRMQVRLTSPRELLPSYRLRAWVADKVIAPLPGSGR